MNLEQLFSLDDDVLTLSEERKTFLKKGVHPGKVAIQFNTFTWVNNCLPDI